MPTLSDITDLIETTAPAMLGIPRLAYKKSKPHQSVYGRGHYARLRGEPRIAPYKKPASGFANAFFRGWDAAELWLATNAGRMWQQDRDQRDACWLSLFGKGRGSIFDSPKA